MPDETKDEDQLTSDKEVAMLTTIDNPHSPFDSFDAWLEWDQRSGYHTSELLARVSATSDELSEPDQRAAVQAGMDEIVRENVSGRHVKVTKPLKLLSADI